MILLYVKVAYKSIVFLEFIGTFFRNRRGGDLINKWEKEVTGSLLGSEAEALEELEKQYERALKDIGQKIKAFQVDIDMLDAALNSEGLDDKAKERLKSQRRSKVYQKQYQETLQGQISGVLDKLHSDTYTTIEEYLKDCYEKGYVGTMYDIAKQGIPIIAPIDQAAVVKAVLTDSKISRGLYGALGYEVSKLKKTISAEVSRGIASSLSYADIARNLRNASKLPLSNANRIVRTEGHRIQQASTMDAQKVAKSKGADIVKQWDAVLDGRTRDSHRRVDGETRELEEKFSNGLLYPGDPSGSAAEVINCRCTSNTRAKWGLDEDELETLKERAAYFGLDKTKNFEDYKKKFLGTTDEWDSADASAKKALKADARDDLRNIVARSTTKIKQGFSAFPDGDVLVERTKLVKPDGNKFDVALHGMPDSVAFGSKNSNMSPRLLASIIRHSEGYNGQEVRLLSCNTGVQVDGGYCFAEELANALGIAVYAPNDLIFFRKDGTFYIGENHDGAILKFKPNERRRLK